VFKISTLESSQSTFTSSLLVLYDVLITSLPIILSHSSAPAPL